MKTTTVRGWVHAGESSFAFVGGACDFEFDELRLVNANHNLVEILTMSDSHHVGVTVVVTDELGQIDEDPVWEGIGEASAIFDKPPRLTRTGEDRSNQSGVSPSLQDLPLGAGIYRIRGYVSGANAASQRRLTTSGTDGPPDDPDTLMEQFRVEFAPATALEEPRVIRRRYEQAQF